jgi:hypothetical protein
MHNNELNTYLCDKFFSEDSFNNFDKKIFHIESLMIEYENFISDIENFFNSQLENDDLLRFKGKIFELSDAKGILTLPFMIQENKLKFMETDAWRSTILSALAVNKCQLLLNKIVRQERKEEENEQYNLSKL